MESVFKKYGKEISLPLIELRLAISLKEPIKDRKSHETSLEEIMEQIKEKLEQINTLAMKIIKQTAQETNTTRIYKKTKTLSSKTETALERIENCENLMEKISKLRSPKSIETTKIQTMEEFQNLYEVVRRITRIIG